jgi:DNA-binding MarR family transcriptional regulator
VWLTADEQRVWRNYLVMTARLQSAMSRQLQADCGLSLADYDVLVALDDRVREDQSSHGPGCRIAELGERLGWEQSRLSHQLSRMRARGLVERRGAADDRRAAIVDLTADGSAALASAASGHAELVRALVFDGLPAADLRAVDRWTGGVLARIEARVEAESDRPHA